MAEGGETPYTWTVSAGSLPDGLTLNSGVTGEISGTPAAVGNFTFTIRVEDADTVSVSQQFTLFIAAQACSTSSVNIARTPDAVYNTVTAAYGDAVTGDVIQALAYGFIENLDLDRDISFTLMGGYDCDYTTNSWKTVIIGALTISNGTLTVENLIIQ